MPVLDGLEAAVEIGKLNLDIPIVAMTANVMSENREVYSSVGMKELVSKPFSSQELWACLLKFIQPIELEYKSSSEPEPPKQEAAAPQEAGSILYSAAAQEIFDELEPLLKDSDFDCLSFVERLKPIEGCEALTGQIESLDFRQALETLAKLKERK